MVSLIPEGWAAVTDDSGRRRLDDPHDFVRFEIARAYMCGIPVLAAQLDGAHMPSHKDLPPDIAELSFKQGMLLRMESFDEDADKIALKLKELDGVAAWPGVFLCSMAGGCCRDAGRRIGGEVSPFPSANRPGIACGPG